MPIDDFLQVYCKNNRNSVLTFVPRRRHDNARHLVPRRCHDSALLHDVAHRHRGVLQFVSLDQQKSK